MNKNWLHTCITVAAAAGGQWLSHQFPGVDPLLASAGLAGLLAHLFHVKVTNGA